MAKKSPRLRLNSKSPSARIKDLGPSI
uniref:Uncharacterized protein n=1 Tax=Arundo donax TaxID=35708 RepID=A0A0A8ZK05_ARUDO